MKTILIAGTGSWDADDDIDWYCPTHPFVDYLIQQGVEPLFGANGKPFIWSTNLSGVPFFTRRNKTDWSAGGAALAYFIDARVKTPGETINVIAHSHGLQIVLYACAYYGVRVRSLISVGSPIRKDMLTVSEKARPDITHWLHIHSDFSDKWQLLGQLFDGKLDVWLQQREHPLADSNDFVAGVGHSKLLRAPEHYHYWLDRGWLDSLKDT